MPVSTFSFTGMYPEYPAKRLASENELSPVSATFAVSVWRKVSSSTSYPN